MKNLNVILGTIAAVLLVGTLGLRASQVVAVVSVNFTGNGGGGIDNGQATSLTNLVMDPTGATVETAGAPGYATTNWNNFDRYGNVTSGIIDNTGADSGLRSEWDAINTFSSGVYATYHTSNSKLMNGGNQSDWANGVDRTWTASDVYGANNDQKPAVYMGNIQAWMAAKGAKSYNVVMYVQAWQASWYLNSDHWIQAVTGGRPDWGNMTVGGDLTPHIYSQDAGNNAFTGSFTQIPLTTTNSSSPSQNGNYIVFTGLTNDAILLRSESLGYQAGKIMGFQIVAVIPAPVGVHFLNDGSGGINNSDPGSLASSEVAGASGYTQANWNNLTKWGSGVTLNDSAGSATSLFINWDAGWNGSSGTASGLGTPNGKLMDGYLGGNTSVDTLNTSVYSSSSQAKPLVYVSGLSAWCQAQGATGYKIVMYRCDGGGSYEGTYGWVQSVTGSPSTNGMVGGADLTPRLYNSQFSAFSGTYRQIPNTATSDANKYFGGGNYNVFSGLTNDAVLIRTGSEQQYWGNAALNGFQIIPVVGPKLTSATASPTTLARGQGILITAAVTLGDNSLSSVTVNASAVGGSSSLALVANGAGSYTNTVAISPGTALGSQTLTVNATDSQSFVVSSSLVVTVVATNEVWNGAGSDNKWSTGANWVSGVQPGTGDSATLAGGTQLTGNLDSSFNLASLTFSNTAGSFTITNAANTLTLTGGLTNNSANVQTLAVPVALSGSQTINAAAGNVVISQPVSGSGAGLTLVGNGTLTLSGANTYTGNTTISAGELIGQTGGSCASSAVTVAAGATNGVKVAAANGQWSCAGLTYNSGTTYADFDFGNFTPSSTTAPLNVGALTANNTVKVLLRNVTIPATVGNYPLIHYTGTDPSVSSFSLNSALPLVANAAGGLVVDTANKNVAVGVQLIVPNLTFANAPGIARIISTSDLIAAGLASSQSSPNYKLTVGTPANGGAAFTNSAGTMMKYTNSPSFAGSSDSFSYTVSDGVSSATATVTLNFGSVAGPQLSQSGTDGNGHPVISFHGLPNYTYHMQRSTDLLNWTTLQPGITCDGNGNGSFTDTNTPIPNPVYYRLVYP